MGRANGEGGNMALILAPCSGSEKSLGSLSTMALETRRSIASRMSMCPHGHPILEVMIISSGFHGTNPPLMGTEKG